MELKIMSMLACEHFLHDEAGKPTAVNFITRAIDVPYLPFSLRQLTVFGELELTGKEFKKVYFSIFNINGETIARTEAMFSPSSTCLYKVIFSRVSFPKGGMYSIKYSEDNKKWIEGRTIRINDTSNKKEEPDFSDKLFNNPEFQREIGEVIGRYTEKLYPDANDVSL